MRDTVTVQARLIMACSKLVEEVRIRIDQIPVITWQVELKVC